jgi:hypothetical protein
MAISTIRRRLARRRTRLIAVLALVVVVLGTAAAGDAFDDRRRAKRVEIGNASARRAKRIGRPQPTTTVAAIAVTTTTLAPKTTASEPTTTAPATTKAPVNTVPPTTLARGMGPTYYVAANGDDANSGTAASPWRSLSKSVERLVPGDTLLVRAGRYDAARDEQFNIAGKNGSANAWITVAAYPGERPVIQLNSYWQGFNVINSSFVEIRGFEIIGTALSDQRMTSGVEINKSHHVRVIGNVVHDVGGCGICSIFANHVHVEGNEVYGASKWNTYQTSGISFFQSSNIGGSDNSDGFSMYISANRVHHNTNIARPGPGMLVTDGNCIILDENATAGYQGATLIQNNLCYENGGRGVEVLRSNNVLAVNNTMINNLRHPEVKGGEITAAWALGVTFRNNLTSAARPGDGITHWDSQVTFDSNLHVGQAPTQMSAGDQISASAINADFTLIVDSQGIDAGNRAGAPLTDIRGVRRDANPDIGAFEAA